ncbi:AraC family transcriptional regulator [Flavilitoribacter nigricans]|uniref:AraC family transcriptional regulator n=1 Tax=Flavilitoribacter nigricans (strain ATCC 23147 / DSM 23189 / NBRC 102662 / NCIMB 1420 / SS-2) TaxID=1122177 RepID=A0A2D0MZN3_FLAN2|nr:AraC family transcriptional regulator [Flavilitoribacter nigricans]PHN01752.1 AraC family transcriptional regulator [Flavilitoribacter nigricans DSM 23189 = NBRC 102662]
MKTALQKSPIPATQAFIARRLDDPYFDPNWHFHPEYQLFVVLEGTGTRFVGDSIERFRPGDLVFTGPNLPHLWRSDQEYFVGNSNLRARGVVIYFHDNFLGSALLEKNEAFSLRQLMTKATKGLKILGETSRRIRQMMNGILGLQDFESVIKLMEILHLLSQSTEYDLLSSDGYSNTLKRSDTDRMNRVHDHIMAHFQQRIKLEEVAALAYMTPSSFSRYFKSHTNKTFSQFLSEIRIGHASKLLIEKEMSVAEACFKSGFYTLSNFNRQFKSIHGLSPTEYKQAYLQL